MESAHQVNVCPTLSPTPLALSGDTTVTLTWNPKHVFPQVDPQLEPFNVDIILYTFDLASASWVEHSILFENVANDGSMIVTIPSGVSNDVVPIAIHVATTLHPSTELNRVGLYMDLFQSQQRVGIWSAEYYYVNPDIAGMDGRGLCQNWNEQEGASVPSSLIEGSTPCAPTVAQAELVTSGLSEILLNSVYGNTLYSEQWSKTFHAESARCFRQTIVQTA